MNTKLYNTINKFTVLLICGVISFTLIGAHTSNAISIASGSSSSGSSSSGSSGSSGSSNSIPIDTSNDYNVTMQHTKDFTLDGLVWDISKTMVQSITASTVSWINSGFKGGPSFLTNPSSFFTNLADQVTGSFISSSGALSSLCSPFSVNIRLSLALQQAGYSGASNSNQKKYSCTLSSIIKNAKSSSFNIGIGTTNKTSSVNGFMGGDFSQGGWSAFLGVSEPNNNESGVYLQAQSDLSQKINSRQNQYQQQLNQGNGFLTYSICTDLGSDGASAYASGNSNVTATAGSDGKTTYQSCKDSTPGSVINSVLQKNVNSGVDQLNIAGSVDEVISSLMSQLSKNILTQGLTGVSMSTNSVSKSYISQLSSETTSASTFSNSTGNIRSSYSKYMNTAYNTITTYGKAVGLFESAKASLMSAKTCYSNLASSSNESQATNISQIDSTINQLTVDEAPYVTAYGTASSSYDAYIVKENSSLNNVTDVTTLQTASQALTSFISNDVPAINTASQNAKNDLTSAQSSTKTYQNQATQYLNSCRSAGGN